MHSITISDFGAGAARKRIEAATSHCCAPLQVRSEKTVRDIRRNLIVHGKGARRGPLFGGASSGRGTNGQPNPEEIGREEAMLERAVAQAEVRVRSKARDHLS